MAQNYIDNNRLDLALERVYTVERMNVDQDTQEEAQRVKRQIERLLGQERARRRH